MPTPTWWGAADDLIEGTVVSVAAAWDAVADAEGPLGDATMCQDPLPALRLELDDVRSLRGVAAWPVAPTTVTVRLGAGTALWAVAPIADPNSPRVAWRGGLPAVVAGMRIGGAVYRHALSDLPVLLAGVEPLYEVVDGRVWFQDGPSLAERCGGPFPATEALDGLPHDALLDAVAAARLTVDPQQAAAYRAWLRVDDTTFSVFGAICAGAFCLERAE